MKIIKKADKNLGCKNKIIILQSTFATLAINSIISPKLMDEGRWLSIDHFVILCE